MKWEEKNARRKSESERKKERGQKKNMKGCVQGEEEGGEAYRGVEREI